MHDPESASRAHCVVPRFLLIDLLFRTNRGVAVGRNSMVSRGCSPWYKVNLLFPCRTVVGDEDSGCKCSRYYPKVHLCMVVGGEPRGDARDRRCILPGPNIVKTRPLKGSSARCGKGAAIFHISEVGRTIYVGIPSTKARRKDIPCVLARLGMIVPGFQAQTLIPEVV
jgi:hypothetical protein